jgi:hypothetical protein
MVGGLEEIGGGGVGEVLELEDGINFFLMCPGGKYQINC